MSYDIKSIAFSPDWDEQPTSSPTAKRTATSRIEKAPLRVIVADDDPVSREIVVGFVTKWGFDVVATSDGREAMEALRAQAGPVLAILDWMMPGMEGPEICRRVREVNRSVHIVLLTARCDKERLVEGLRAGADDYITKPFDREELQARLNVGGRIVALQKALSDRVAELEQVVAENRALKLQIPI
jgi:DNA-binding response OmpR family regulator